MCVSFVFSVSFSNGAILAACPHCLTTYNVRDKISAPIQVSYIAPFQLGDPLKHYPCPFGRLSDVEEGRTDVIVQRFLFVVGIFITCYPSSLSNLLLLSYISQDGTDGINFLQTATALADGSVVLAGSTTGSWSGSNQGEEDFAAVKLDVDGVEVWRWQVGDGCISSDVTWMYFPCFVAAIFAFEVPSSPVYEPGDEAYPARFETSVNELRLLPTRPPVAEKTSHTLVAVWRFIQWLGCFKALHQGQPMRKLCVWCGVFMLEHGDRRPFGVQSRPLKTYCFAARGVHESMVYLCGLAKQE